MFAHSKHQFNGILSLVAIFSLLLINRPIWAQNDTISKKQVNDTNVYRRVDKSARQIRNWNSYLGESLEFPKQFSKDNVSVKVILEFIVEKNGRLSHPKAIKSTGYINDKTASEEQLQPFIDEAFRVIINSPKWQPAVHNDTIVRSYFTVPVVLENR